MLLLKPIYVCSADSLWSETCSDMSRLSCGNAANNIPDPMVSSTDSSTVCADHEYHEISDEENQESPLRFDKPLSFDFGPSLLDEMDQMFRSLGTFPEFSLYVNPKINHATFFLFLFFFFLVS